MSKHRTSLSNLRPATFDGAAFLNPQQLSRQLDRAQAFAACREGFRAWARAGFPGDDPFSIYRTAAAPRKVANG